MGGITNRQDGDVTSRRSEGGGGPRGFTLLELLLVIAIVSMLVAMSFPTFVGIRQAARMTQSLSNNRGLWAATMAYREDNRQNLPIRYNMPGSLTVWASWFYGGKHCDPRWADKLSALYDLPPPQRPLNKYVMPDAVFTDREDRFTPVPADVRRSEQAEPFRSPGDRITYQGLDGPFPTADPTRSSYDDVGTSYHMNIRWLKPMTRMLNDTWRANRGGPSSNRAANDYFVASANRRFLLADQHASGRVIFLYDQTVDVVANDSQQRDWMGEFGELNKGVVTFIGGSSEYIKLKPGASNTPQYTFMYFLPGEDEAKYGTP
jgi:prepilin-type N-terminal cleavage/methylation domain-containing protein